MESVHHGKIRTKARKVGKGGQGGTEPSGGGERANRSKRKKKLIKNKTVPSRGRRALAVTAISAGNDGFVERKMRN